MSLLPSTVGQGSVYTQQQGVFLATVHLSLSHLQVLRCPQSDQINLTLG